MGAAGPTILFVILLVAALIAGLYIVAYTSNVFLTIIQQTAGGIDTITWTKEPWNDWIGKTLHLALIVACWLVPLGIVLRLIGPESLAASTALYVGVPALVFCLLFPITLLSSFSGGSPLRCCGRKLFGAWPTVREGPSPFICCPRRCVSLVPRRCM